MPATADLASAPPRRVPSRPGSSAAFRSQIRSQAARPVTPAGRHTAMGCDYRYRRALSTTVVHRNPGRTRIPRDTEADKSRRTTRYRSSAGRPPNQRDDNRFRRKALVENREPRDGAFNLPDPDDEQAMATALVGGPGSHRHWQPQGLPDRDELWSQLAFDRAGGSVHKFVGHGGQEEKS